MGEIHSWPYFSNFCSRPSITLLYLLHNLSPSGVILCIYEFDIVGLEGGKCV